MKTIKTAIKSTLIIDPDENENVTLISIFKEYGLELDIITRENDFLEKLNNNRYECVMIHSDLPENYTDKIVDTLKIDFPNIVVIILLENPTFDKIFHFVRSGVDDFILKPFIWDDIEKLLRFYYY
ncbi:MAG: hypothetical protein FWG98_01710 [Candidatus Cloacimonetes bacterium]|nr:hypothetical protein [Candidatus Cloacimonadota bacterium]